MIKTSVLLLCAGREEVSEIRGSYPMIAKFEKEVLSKKATKLALPVYITAMYVMDSEEELEAAKAEWESFPTE